MKDDAAEKYCTLMNELKKRQALLKRVGEGHVPWLVLEAQMEFVYLQFRQILELIAMAEIASILWTETSALTCSCLVASEDRS